MSRLIASLLLLAAFHSGCKTAPTAPSLSQDEARSPASGNLTLQQLFQRLYHAHLYSQILIREFDQRIAASDYDGRILESETYAKLLATRALVDEFEHRIGEFYLAHVRTAADSAATSKSREEAEKGLRAIGEFMGGLISADQRIPASLRVLVLTNLRLKQTDLLEALGEMAKTPGLQLKKLHEHRVKIRATRRAYLRELSRYKLDPKELDAAIAIETRKPEYLRLDEEISELSREMEQIQEALRRDPANQAIAPGIGPSGNITGNGFPEKIWSLTYDDGPGPSTTGELLKDLKESGIKGTFFMLAEQVEKLPAVAQSIKESGMDLALHSYTHKQLTKVPSEVLEREIAGAKAKVEEKLGASMRLFRLPYGAGVSVQRIRQKIADNRMIHVFWNVDTLDWSDKNPESIVKRSRNIMKGLRKDAGIILFHDIHPQSIKASKLLAKEMLAESKRFCTVQSVVDRINGGATECQ